MKKLFCIILILSFALALFAGCAKENAADEKPSSGGRSEERDGDVLPDCVLEDYSLSGGADEKVSFDAKPREAAPSFYGDYHGEAVVDGVEKEPADIGTHGGGAQTQPSPFVLTAGEWNDNRNWSFFTNLVTGKLISFPSFGLDPTKRIEVTLKNGDEPVANAKVELVSGGNTVWAAKTDKDGKAYLFSGGASDLSIRVEGEEKATEVELAGVRGDSQSQNGGFDVITSSVVINTKAESAKYDKTEVMFILDTTGSMGDEIAYLQKDFSSIAKEVEHEGLTFSIDFYRDEGDAYVTKTNGFTSDADAIIDLLNKESANGGGDTPEAVAKILEETLIKAQWSEKSNKIAFLIFDAPPHDGTDETIERAVKAAAEKGIKVVPVVASNADRETELFGRALAVMTGANYVFLTDDSGVGGSHLEPIIGEYEVELLHDIIVRNIKAIEG